MGSKRQHGTKCNRASQHNAIDNCEFVWKVHISRHIIVSLNPPMLGTVMHLGGHNAKHALHPLGTDIITQSGPGPLAVSCWTYWLGGLLRHIFSPPIHFANHLHMDLWKLRHLHYSADSKVNPSIAPLPLRHNSHTIHLHQCHQA